METIKSRREFEQVFSQGKRANHRLVRITVLDSDEGDNNKVAFVAAKRLGNAVWRNRCKRVLREAFREIEFPYQGRKVILFATRQTHDAHPHEVSEALNLLFDRIR